MEITKEYLLNRGFRHQTYGAGGQDQWAGLDAWKIDTDFGKLTFRGDPSSLRLAGYFESRIETIEELEFLIRILSGTNQIWMELNS